MKDAPETNRYEPSTQLVSLTRLKMGAMTFTTLHVELMFDSLLLMQNS